jgi:hypothetical protein
VLLSDGNGRADVINDVTNDVVNAAVANNAHDDVLLLLPNVYLKAHTPSKALVIRISNARF